MDDDNGPTPLEAARLKRATSIPKPTVPVKCRRCGSLEKETLFNRNANLDFYWRYYHCKACKQNYWCGVRHADNLTVFTIHTPKLTRVNSTDIMTGNLRNILPIGHSAVTAEYNQFLPNGKLPRNVLMAKLDAEDTEAQRRNPDSITPSNEDDMKKTYILPETVKCLRCGELDSAGSFLTGHRHTFHSGEWRWTMIKHLAPNCGKNFWWGTDVGYGTIKFYRNKPMEHGIISHAEECEIQAAKEQEFEKLRGKLLNVATSTPSKEKEDPATFKEWLDIHIDELRAAGYTDDQEDAVFRRWVNQWSKSND